MESGPALIGLLLLFFIASMVGVVTGSNSLITVPVMFQFGIDPKVAIATNMFGLTFMSLGASIPFLRQGSFDREKLPLLLALTLAGSAIGAALVGMASPEAVPWIVSFSMAFVVVFSLLRPGYGVGKGAISGRSKMLAYFLAFLLAIYGGLYSGGYVTMLTAVFVAFLGMTFTEAVANTKLVNAVSSLIATLVFMWQGLIDYKLGALLAITMFAAGFAGAKTVTKINDIWLKRIFLAAAAALALKTMIDFGLR